VPSTCPIQGGRRVLPTEGRDEEGPFALAPVPLRAKVAHREKRGCRDTTGEEGERKKTPRDIQALHRQIRELLDKREQSLKNEDDYQWKVADQQTKIERLQDQIQGLCRTVAGSGFSLGRLKKEGDEGRKGNQELERRTTSSKKC